VPFATLDHLALGELDGVELGRLRHQKQEVSASGLDALADASVLVGRQLFHP